MKYSMSHVNLAMELMLRDLTKKSVTVFFGKLNNVTARIRVSRSKKHFKYYRRGNRTWEELSVTIGAPNFAEREFLKQCKKADCNPKRWWATFFKEKKNAKG